MSAEIAGCTAALVVALALAGCGSSEPSLDDVTKAAKRQLHTTHVRCNADAPPHEYYCDYRDGYNERLQYQEGTATFRSAGKRIYVVPGSN
jgi:hypothetical protein